MKKAISFIIPALIILIAVGIYLTNYFSSRVAANDISVVGNTPGNLISGGTFCEYNGTIFFSNPYDDGRLYSMSSDCSDIRFISEDTASYINAAGKHIYYIKGDTSLSADASVISVGDTNGIIRCKFDGSDKTSISSGYCSDMVLSGNTLIFNAVRNFSEVTYSVSIKGKDKTVINTQNFSNASVSDGNIYYSASTNDRSVYTMNINTGDTALYMAGETYMASRYDNYLYYIDLSNGNALTRVNLDTFETNIISSDYCTLYNVYGDIVFYTVKGEENALMRSNTDGSNAVRIFAGEALEISCTSIYTFFKIKGHDNLFRTETFNDSKVQNFYIMAE